MTIRFISAWNGYSDGEVATLDNESDLISAGIARSVNGQLTGTIKRDEYGRVIAETIIDGALNWTRTYTYNAVGRATVSKWVASPMNREPVFSISSPDNRELIDSLSNDIEKLRGASFGIFGKAFLIGGQSNGDGAAKLPAVADQPHPGVLLYTKDETIELCSEPAGRRGANWIDNRPEGNVTTGGKYSFTTSLGKAIVNITGINPLMVPCAIGSTSLQNWVPPVTEDDMTTLFGAMTARAKKAIAALPYGENPIFIWHGHEANSAEVTENLATGIIGLEYIDRWIDHIANIRARFPNAVVMFAQLATHDSASLATNLRRAAESQRLSEADYGNTTTIVEWIPSGAAIDFSSWGSKDTDANNTATVSNGELTLTWDGSKILEGWIDTLTPGKYYKINVTATGSSNWRFFSDTTQVGGTRSPGTLDIEFLAGTWNNNGDTSKARARFIEPSGTTPGSITIKINSLQEAVHPSIKNTYMVVTHDLPRNANPDGYHLNTVGSREVGRRFALAYAQRVLGMHWINGTGPRLVSVTKPTTTTVKVKFDRAIQANANGYGINLANSLFRVYDGGVEKTLSSCERDPSDDTAVLITLTVANAGVVVVTYGDRAGPADESWRQGVVYDSDNMPAPMFGPVIAV